MKSVTKCPRKAAAGAAGESLGAFTLIELMVVVVLIGIVTAMILPEMKGTFEDMLLRSTGRGLVSAFALASSQAITVNQAHRVRLDLVHGQYFVEKTGRQAQAGSLDHLPGAKGELDKRIRVQIRKAEQGTELSEDRLARPNATPGQRGGQAGDRDAFTFYPDGTADAGEVLLRDREGFGLALRINSTTGRVHIVEAPRQ